MKRWLILLMVAALFQIPGLAAAQAQAPAPEKAPATAPAPAPTPEAAKAPTPAQPGPGMPCPMMSPEQMKQMHGKMGQCCMMQQQGQACPMHQQVQKQLDELSKRVEALEKVKGKKK